MRILIDTNVLISAFVFGGKAGKLMELRDKKDIPILCDALFHNVDIILSGDKDFLEAGLDNPLVFSPSMLFDYLS